MITIRYKDTGKRRKLTVQGHGGGEAGKDIYCAAASTLVITLVSALANARVKYTQELRDGYAEIGSNRPESKSVFYTCMCGFFTLAKMYPDYYTVIS